MRNKNRFTRIKILQHIESVKQQTESDTMLLSGIQQNMDKICKAHSPHGACVKCPLRKNGCVKAVIENVFYTFGIDLKPAPKEIIRTYSEENWHGLER